MQESEHAALERRTREVVRELLGVLLPDEFKDSHPHLGDTPRRVTDWLLQYAHPETDLSKVMRVFEEEHTGMILEKDIPFTSLCAHHLLPFQGKAAVAYVPNGKIAGISKLTRVTWFYANRVTLQEEVTKSIVDGMFDLLEPIYVAAYLYDVTHGCMTVRGVKTLHVTTDTFDDRGGRNVLGEREENRALFWNMLGRGR